MNWIGMVISAVLGGGTIAALARSFRWPRPYERVIVTGPRNLVRDKQTGRVREYTGFIFRPVGFYRMELVNIRDRTDLISLEGVMRPALDQSHPETQDHREKWQLSATAKWHIEEGFVYFASVWMLDDIGEFARGKIQDAILTYLEDNPVTMDLNTAEIFAGCEPGVRDALKEHGVVWTDLMVNKNALADAEIQGKAIRRVAKSVERLAEVIQLRRKAS